MRRTLPLIAISALLVLSGCNQLSRWRLFPERDIDHPPQSAPPTAEQLVEYLNQNSDRLKAMQCDNMTVNAWMGAGVFRNVTLEAHLRCQQPRDFRLLGNMPGGGVRAVDLGSNAEEFWFWVKDVSGPDKKPSPIFHCAYEELDKGQVKVMPFPFQPEWILETLCMSDFGPATRWQLKVEGNELKLIERTISPQGAPVLKVIVFARTPVLAPTPQIKAFLLVDEATKKEICSARVEESQVERKTGGLLPKTLVLSWPEQDMKLRLNLGNATTEVGFKDNPHVFMRQAMTGLPSFDMASGQFDANPSSLQKVQGFGRLN
jgi:hypothetical protein